LKEEFEGKKIRKNGKEGFEERMAKKNFHKELYCKEEF
jgi:hypothetical protein